MMMHILADTTSTSPANVSTEYTLMLLAAIAIVLFLGILIIWQIGRIWHTQDLKEKNLYQPKQEKAVEPAAWDTASDRVQVTEDDQPSDPEDWLFEQDPNKDKE